MLHHQLFTKLKAHFNRQPRLSRASIYNKTFNLPHQLVWTATSFMVYGSSRQGPHQHGQRADTLSKTKIFPNSYYCTFISFTKHFKSQQENIIREQQDLADVRNGQTSYLSLPYHNRRSTFNFTGKPFTYSDQYLPLEHLCSTHSAVFNIIVCDNVVWTLPNSNQDFISIHTDIFQCSCQSNQCASVKTVEMITSIAAMKIQCGLETEAIISDEVAIINHENLIDPDVISIDPADYIPKNLNLQRDKEKTLQQRSNMEGKLHCNIKHSKEGCWK